MFAISNTGDWFSFFTGAANATVHSEANFEQTAM
jgi:hypothetical protein